MRPSGVAEVKKGWGDFFMFIWRTAMKDSNIRYLATASIIIALLFLQFACSTVPVTGRKSLNLLPDSELLSMSLQEYDQVLKDSKLSNDPNKVQMVKRVGERVAGATEAFLRENGMSSEIKNYKWEFNLIQDDKVVNAWCMPGGKVAVYTGILPITRNDTGLAVVMGHEVAHAIAKHGNERMSQQMLAQLGAIGLSAALSTHPSETNQIFMMAYGVGATVGVLLPYSRLQESEADRIGLILMAKAGYDPRQAVPFWERMNDVGGSRPPEFLATHPTPETRIKQIEAEVPEAMKYYRGN
jgi:predicted Zn-dependent protease